MKTKIIANKQYYIPNPDKILVFISTQQIEDLTSKEIVRDDGRKVRLFTEPQYDKGFDRRFQQNVSVGKLLAIGEHVTGIMIDDIPIIDYLVTNNDDLVVAYGKEGVMAAIDWKTTYHDTDAKPYQDGRRAWVKGDYNLISPLLGVVRGDKLIAFSPYCFLVHQSNKIVKVRADGKIEEEIEKISTREILSASPGTKFHDGDKILIKEEDMFSRHINGKEISVAWEKEILGKV